MERKRYNVVRLYRLGKVYRLVAFKRGLSEQVKIARYKRAKNEKKFESSIVRAKTVIFELAMCNEWDYFCTFTVDGAKFARDDLRAFYKSFSKFINNWNNRKYPVKYILIPELHSDGVSWHFHGLMSGLKRDDLSRFELGKHPLNLVKGDYWNWLACSSRFGFCSLSPIRNAEAVSKYITKYVTKELLNQSQKVNAHLYYCSKGLARKVLCADVSMSEVDAFDFDFENDFVKIRNVEGKEVERILEFMQLMSISPLRKC